jgi:hypothetical protein
MSPKRRNKSAPVVNPADSPSREDVMLALQQGIDPGLAACSAHPGVFQEWEAHFKATGSTLASLPLRVILQKLGFQLRSRRLNRTCLLRPTSSPLDSLSMPALSPLFSNGLMRPPHAHHPHQRLFPHRRKWITTWPPPPPHPPIATLILSKLFTPSLTRSPMLGDSPTSRRPSLKRCMKLGAYTTQFPQ